ncbi:MAG: CsbD family protein [Actinomycetota bacterium]|nr:CsbD family protein [Actinomycetota bacterium]
MSLQDKITNKGQVLKGKAKEALGKASDDPELEAEGKTDQGKGNLKQAGEKAKDAGKDIFGK